MWRLTRSAGEGGASPNSTNGVLKSLKFQRNRTRMSTRFADRSEGSVIERNWRQLEAPSTAAASYISVGMFCSAASRMRNAYGNHRQTAAATIDQNALLPNSQNGGLWARCSSWTSTVLTTPLSRWSMKLQTMIAT